jgi:prepilin-type N-terminal cleavage/methylation domain-containing protein
MRMGLAAAQRVADRSGMTLVEVMIVVSIIGFLAVLAVPQVRHARQRSQDTAFINDLRILTGQLFDYHGFGFQGFPEEMPPGVVPPAVTNSLPKRFDWAAPTAIGGYWTWRRAATRGEKVEGICYAGLAVHQPKRTTADMRKIDERIDDGNLSTGLFRSITDGYIHVVEY